MLKNYKNNMLRASALSKKGPTKAPVTMLCLSIPEASVMISNDLNQGAKLKRTWLERR
jgi:hypothetical protein